MEERKDATATFYFCIEFPYSMRRLQGCDASPGREGDADKWQEWKRNVKVTNSDVILGACQGSLKCRTRDFWRTELHTLAAPYYIVAEVHKIDFEALNVFRTMANMASPMKQSSLGKFMNIYNMGHFLETKRSV